MWQLGSEGLAYLSSQSLVSLLHLFWFMIIFEFPRYTLSFLSVVAISVRTARTERRHTNIGRVVG